MTALARSDPLVVHSTSVRSVASIVLIRMLLRRLRRNRQPEIGAAEEGDSCKHAFCCPTCTATFRYPGQCVDHLLDDICNVLPARMPNASSSMSARLSTESETVLLLAWRWQHISTSQLLELRSRLIALSLRAQAGIEYDKHQLAVVEGQLSKSLWTVGRQVSMQSLTSINTDTTTDDFTAEAVFFNLRWTCQNTKAELKDIWQPQDDNGISLLCPPHRLDLSNETHLAVRASLPYRIDFWSPAALRQDLVRDHVPKAVSIVNDHLHSGRKAGDLMVSTQDELLTRDRLCEHFHSPIEPVDAPSNAAAKRRAIESQSGKGLNSRKKQRQTSSGSAAQEHGGTQSSPTTVTQTRIVAEGDIVDRFPCPLCSGNDRDICMVIRHVWEYHGILFCDKCCLQQLWLPPRERGQTKRKYHDNFWDQHAMPGVGMPGVGCINNGVNTIDFSWVDLSWNILSRDSNVKTWRRLSPIERYIYIYKTINHRLPEVTQEHSKAKPHISSFNYQRDIQEETPSIQVQSHQPLELPEIPSIQDQVNQGLPQAVDMSGMQGQRGRLRSLLRQSLVELLDSGRSLSHPLVLNILTECPELRDVTAIPWQGAQPPTGGPSASQQNPHVGPYAPAQHQLDEQSLALHAGPSAPASRLLCPPAGGMHRDDSATLSSVLSSGTSFFNPAGEHHSDITQASSQQHPSFAFPAHAPIDDVTIKADQEKDVASDADQTYTP